MDVPKITWCDATNCAYNHDGHCHAIAITIGDKLQPQCDTFLDSPIKGGDSSATGTVGACKVSICKYNEMYECHAPQIHLERHQKHVDCATFSPK